MEIIYSKEKEIQKFNQIDSSMFKFIEIKDQTVEKINSKPYSY
ncbi:hypothetical protein [Spiroplasma taiwanense]|uniref:Uncharacterized protein n=1 Tax=Spiroplasma taiwanense CT-1 TaxID=1276220 RepID=S5LXY1_9MOLU|nr:hypothetical protein [Spiroplasma taiwanense]AGR41461.1 hypothetical protein STAIW_v1c08750 [Spiroplasma taiwanense CT-1]